jgi:hypothetical protein
MKLGDEEFELVISSDLGGSYEFDELCVWKNGEGNLFYAIDSGCSCPIPFEWVISVNDLKPLTLRTFEMFTKDAEQEWGQYLNDAFTKSKKMDVVRKVWSMLQEQI